MTKGLTTLSLGAAIKASRQSRGLTLDYMQRETGINKGNLSKIEHGADNITVGTLRKIAAAIGTEPGLLLSMIYIMDGEEEKE